MKQGYHTYISPFRFFLILCLLLCCQALAETGSEDKPDSTETGEPEVVEEEFSLDDLDEEEEAGEKKHAGGHGASGGRPSHAGGGIEAVIAVDATLEGYNGKSKELSFASNHEYLVLGFHPRPNINFLIEVIEVVYWEFQYSISRDTRLKIGKIGIPFGPLFLHQIMGGLVEKPLTGGGGRHFMVPHVWTEYGLGLEQRFIDSYLYSLKGSFWLTNGLQGEVNVADQTVDFTGDSRDWDTNLDKALGMRLTNKFLGKYSLNLSFYTCKWAPDAKKDNGELAEKFYEGDRLTLGNVDFELGYNTIPLPFLRNLKFLGEYAQIRTRSTQVSSGQDKRVPWHNKSATLLEVKYNGLKWFDVRLRYGTYDDNWDVINNRDVVHFNTALMIPLGTGVSLVPMYMLNRERVNEVDDDYLMIKFFLEL